MTLTQLKPGEYKNKPVQNQNKRVKTLYLNSKKNTWREFQSELQLSSRRKKRFSGLKKLFIPVLTIFALVYFLNLSFPGFINNNMISNLMESIANFHFSDNKNNPADKDKALNQTYNKITKAELQHLLKDNKALINREKSRFILNYGSEPIEIDTSLNEKLQRFIISKLDMLKTIDRGKPQRIAMVVMKPATGRILAMAGFDLSNPEFNTCTQGQYPAASVFKIVTASAAIENCGYHPNTPIYFNGGKYTLYKRQLKERKNKYTIKVSFAHAFAESINPVFGRIGSKYLGGETLQKYASAFGFNRNIESDFPFKTGCIKITDRPYQWAEVGCGFNETTKISPVFALVLSGTLLNSGMEPVPGIVDKVKNSHGKTIYTRKQKTAMRIIDAQTAETMMKMMEKTITTGTAKKSFRGFKRNRILSRLTIGGKTGSIYNKEHSVKYDWFTGFARAKKSKEQIVLAVLVGHRKYIGTRAARYGRMIIKKYFTLYFDSEKKL